jgi:WhiB family redox-sensing transcriptional regulator
MTAMWTPVFDWDNDGWRDQAACRDTDPNLFFPAGSTGLAIEQIEAAKAVCRSCPVQDACLRFAFETNQEAGIWGGTDEDERRRLRRSWRAGRQARTRSATT